MTRTNRISLIQGDITNQAVDAIVNAANTSLRGGGGVDGAIHRAAGPELLAECIAIGGCPTGEARITRGCRLPARWVIHTVGPIWNGGRSNEAELLASCYRSSLELAAKPEYAIQTIAFPSISTGAYGYPLDQAARIALLELERFLRDSPVPAQVTFVLFSPETLAAYQNALEMDTSAA